MRGQLGWKRLRIERTIAAIFNFIASAAIGIMLLAFSSAIAYVLLMLVARAIDIEYGATP